MKPLSRRAFMHSSSVLAAGAVIGMPAYQGLREYGPVDLRMHFFTKEPLVIKGALFSDEKKDLFGIRVFFNNSRHQTGEVRMPLSRIRQLAGSRIPAATMKADCQYADGNIEPHNLLAIIIKGDLILKEDEHDGAPFWLSMADVERVL